jgi:hypothetical protein
MGSITAANSTYTITVPDIFPAPQILQGYSTDDAFETEQSEMAEVVIGVDGYISAGFVPFMTNQTVILQADSPSIAFFDAWMEYQVAQRETYQATGAITMPAIGRSYILTQGYFLNGVSIAGVRKTLQARRFTIRWGSIVPVPI